MSAMRVLVQNGFTIEDARSSLISIDMRLIRLGFTSINDLPTEWTPLRLMQEFGADAGRAVCVLRKETVQP